MAGRLASLSGLSIGLVLSPLVPQIAASTPAALLLLAALGLVAMGAPSGRPLGGPPNHPRVAGARGVWLLTVLAVAAGAGLLLGAARVRAIDAGALQGRPGSRLTLEGDVVSVPRRTQGKVRVAVETAAGRLLFESPEPVPEIDVGEQVRATGILARPPDYYAATLRRQGISMLLRAGGITPTGERRGGLLGHLDRVRERAQDGLGAGMPEREAALARGFVLGQDDRIDGVTVEDFRRAGLSHLLAVSGQNVVLLGLLAAPLLAALGVGLRQRLLWTCGLIAVYVPLAGGGASIQRAGVMGAAAIVATLAGRPASRAYALLLAAALTLLLNPRSSGDVGWQLSFAAVAGIYLLAAPIRAAICARSGCGGWRRPLAEGAAVTAAATIATTPLIAHHFGMLSLGSLAANLLALPAVAPAMWLGMISAALAQFPGIPTAPLNAVNSVLLAYIAQIAAWFGRPDWAVLDITLEGPLQVLAAYVVLIAGTGAGLRVAARRRHHNSTPAEAASRRIARLGAGAALVALLLAGSVRGEEQLNAGPARGLRVQVLDVGQGDAILLQPPFAEPILVDGGPPGGDLAAILRAAGVEELAAVVLSHDQSDHAGGVREALGTLPVKRFVYAAASAAIVGQARASGARTRRVGAGGQLRSGSLRLDVLWPPQALLGAAGAGSDPNQRSLVILARWGSFSMLLTGDAEAEAVPIDPGPVDVLKVSHHGSEDSGLGALLERTAPKVAVISVGEGNPFGHPTPSTLASLHRHGVRVMRTDRDGTLVIDAARTTFTVGGAG